MAKLVESQPPPDNHIPGYYTECIILNLAARDRLHTDLPSSTHLAAADHSLAVGRVTSPTLPNRNRQLHMSGFGTTSGYRQRGQHQWCQTGGVDRDTPALRRCRRACDAGVKSGMRGWTQQLALTRWLHTRYNPQNDNRCQRDTKRKQTAKAKPVLWMPRNSSNSQEALSFKLWARMQTVKMVDDVILYGMKGRRPTERLQGKRALAFLPGLIPWAAPTRSSTFEPTALANLLRVYGE